LTHHFAIGNDVKIKSRSSSVNPRAREVQNTGSSRKILALAKIYGAEALARAISDGLAFGAFSAPR
jgi:hypothetical protein